MTAYLECEHLTQLEVKVARGEIVKPHVDDAQAVLLRRKGDEHERACLAQLLADGRDVVTIELGDDDREWDWGQTAGHPDPRHPQVGTWHMLACGYEAALR